MIGTELFSIYYNFFKDILLIDGTVKVKRTYRELRHEKNDKHSNVFLDSVYTRLQFQTVVRNSASESTDAMSKSAL